MRKEYIFFFVLLGVAAMITGFTVGFFANYSFIEQGIEQHKAAALEKESAKHELVKDEVHKTEDTHETPVDKTGKNTATTEANVVTGSNFVVQPMVDGSQIDIPVSPEDMKAVIAMLDELNVADASTYELRIRNFQQQSGLEQTGVLDSETLNAIIQQVAIKHAQRNMYGG